MPLLSELIPADAIVSVHGALDIPIGRIIADSREVEAGDVYLCLPGYKSEGGETRADRHDFIPMALQRGAVALVVQRETAAIDGLTIVRVRDSWSTIAAMASRYYANPSAQLTMVGVTGTSGKTSTTYFIESVLQAAGHRTARIGTVEYRIGDTVLPASQTTPEATVLHAILRRAVDAGCSAAVLEVSSHALELRRVGAIAFDAGVFTNLSHDHLNFHPDMAHYTRAKGRLFEGLGSTSKRAAAIINVDDPASVYMRQVNRGTLTTYGIEQPADIAAAAIGHSAQGMRFELRTPQGSAPIRLRHLGEYSVYNALAAAGVGHALGVDLATIARGLEAAPPVPGRFELVEAGQDFVVAVDYAHKPDALERLIRSARKLDPGRVITVVGCGGDRDRSKRPIMGRVAADLSDHVILTSDNPRSEPPAAIIDEIAVGARAVDPHAARHIIEVDRAAAIRSAVTMAQPRDIVLIAGKGHETYQLIAGKKYDFDDRVHARDAIRARLGR